MRKNNNFALKLAILAVYTLVVSSVYKHDAVQKEVISNPVQAVEEVAEIKPVIEEEPTPTVVPVDPVDPVQKVIELMPSPAAPDELSVQKVTEDPDSGSLYQLESITDVLAKGVSSELLEDPILYRDFEPMLFKSYEWDSETETFEIQEIYLVSVVNGQLVLKMIDDEEIAKEIVTGSTSVNKAKKDSGYRYDDAKKGISTNSASADSASKNSVSRNDVKKSKALPGPAPAPAVSVNLTSVSWNGGVLTKHKGVNQGPSGKETYYNLPMDGIVSMMRGMGNTDEHWIREDGVHMLGEYVMVAANLDMHPRGSYVETSLGIGIVADTGGFAYANPTQLDIATTW